MLSVIMGKPKTVVTPMPSNLLVVGGSFTGRLKIYDRDTLQEVTGIDTSAMNDINSLAYDSNYIYVGGTFSAAPHVRKISRTTKVISAVGTNATWNGNIGSNAILIDNGFIVVSEGTTNSISNRLHRFNILANQDTNVIHGRKIFRYLAQSDSYIYASAYSYTSSTYSIYQYTKNPLAYLTYLATTSIRFLTADSNFLYSGSTTSGDFHVYDLALTTEQTGYPTIPGGIYSILNDDTNVYIGSYENVYVINKASKALTTVALGVASTVKAMAQDADYVYVAISSRILAFSKSTLSGVSIYKELGTSLTNAIMVI